MNPAWCNETINKLARPPYDDLCGVIRPPTATPRGESGVEGAGKLLLWLSQWQAHAAKEGL